MSTSKLQLFGFFVFLVSLHIGRGENVRSEEGGGKGWVEEERGGEGRTGRVGS